MVGRGALLVLAVGCSVPDVDLTMKSCPCESGYACVANRCERTSGSDGGPIVSCLGSEPTNQIYADNFDAATIDSGWVTSAMWTQTGGELVQNDTNDQLAIAYTTHVTANDYRVVVQMTANSGIAMGISVRQTTGGKQLYDCLWEPGGTGALIIQWTNNGGAATTLMSKVGLPSSQTVTMEFSAFGTQLHCCIDNIGTADVMVSNPSPSYTTGQPGLVTNRTHASFDNFAVYSN